MNSGTPGDVTATYRRETASSSRSTQVKSGMARTRDLASVSTLARNDRKRSSIPDVKAKLLDGKRGLVVGIANEDSIAWGCAKAFRAFGAEVAVTYLNEKAKKFVEPLAQKLEAPILMPLDTRVPGEMEAVFEAIAKTWGSLDFL